MPLDENIRSYKGLRQHVDRLFSAVQAERWQEANDLWFDHFTIHRLIGSPQANEKDDVLYIIRRMDEITGMLKQRRDDIGLLLRISPSN